MKRAYDDDVNDRQWRQFHEACPPVAHVAEVTSPGGEEPVDHVLTIRACDSPISRRHVYTSRGHRVAVALMTSSQENRLHLFVQYQGRIFVRINFKLQQLTLILIIISGQRNLTKRCIVPLLTTE